MRLITTILALVLFAGCDGGGGARENSRGWQPVPAGVVLTRNFMVPPSPADAGYRLLPASYRLGTEAYAKPPPEWWTETVRRTGITDRWHPRDFPLAYVGEFQGKGGTAVLLVVQCSHAFTGDGYSGPGPEIYLVARTLSRENGGLKLLAEQAYDLGSMQNSRLFAGEASGRRVVFPIEKGSGIDSDRVASRAKWTLTVQEDNSLSMERGESVEVK